MSRLKSLWVSDQTGRHNFSQLRTTQKQCILTMGESHMSILMLTVTISKYLQREELTSSNTTHFNHKIRQYSIIMTIPECHNCSAPPNMEAVYDDLAEGLRHHLKGNKQHWIGIAGGPGSGKVSLADIQYVNFIKQTNI